MWKPPRKGIIAVRALRQDPLAVLCCDKFQNCPHCRWTYWPRFEGGLVPDPLLGFLPTYLSPLRLALDRGKVT